MKNILLLTFILAAGLLHGQIVQEDFEDGGKLPWAATNGVYNGIVANPDTAGINASASVGSYTKESGRAFSLFRSQNTDPFSIQQTSIWTMDVWSPIEADIILKLEGPNSTPVEDRLTVPDSSWTTLTFDLRAGASQDGYNDILIFFAAGNAEDSSTYLFDNIIANPVPETTILEDFENGPNLTWTAVNGTYNRAVANPDTSGINPSDSVGSYVKSGMNGFSLFLHESETPIDLSILNNMSIDVYSQTKSEFILKLEGAGEAQEVRTNIPSSNVWRNYQMDFSEASGFTTINKIILFFDPGVEESSDTFYFDNLIASPAGDCAGTEVADGVIDDFECQRNATYDNGWDRLSAVENPDMSLANPSAGAGAYSKPGGQAWAALVADYDNPIDLSTLNQVNAKIWSPVVDRVLFKLEGGASPAKEIFIDITEANAWVDYSADFSEFANEDHKRIAIFMAAGMAFENDTTFYIDDITVTEKVNESSILEDFEMGPNLAWFPQDNDPGNGTFEVIANPDMSDANPSDSVGAYSRGMNLFSALTAVLIDTLDLSGFGQLNLDVWAPEGASTVTMQLTSPTAGLVEATRDITETMTWSTISFDFSGSSMVTDFSSLNLVFDAESEVVGPYYIDNLSQGETTVDACEGIEADPLAVDDFECQRNLAIVGGEGDLEIVPNPDISPANQSSVVGKYTEPEGNWAAVVWESEDPLDLSVYNQLQVKIWAPSVVPMLFKLEGGDGAQEVFMDVTETESWVTYSIDFSESAGKGHTRLVLFMNAGQEPTVGEVYYFDDLRFGLPPFESCIVDFEGGTGAAFNPEGWTYFANGTFADSTLNVITNPAPDDVNMSESVGRFVESAGVGDGSDNVRPFAGVFLRGETPINFTDPDNQTISMDIWMDHEATVVFKLENGLTTGTTGDVMANYTTPNQWQTVTWNYNSFPNDQWKTISLILDFDNVPTENMEYYIDNIRVGGTSCTADSTMTSIFAFAQIPSVQVSPNPAQDQIQIDAPDLFEEVIILDARGVLVKRIRNTFDANSVVNIHDLQRGIFFLQTLDRHGAISGRAKFIKH